MDNEKFKEESVKALKYLEEQKWAAEEIVIFSVSCIAMSAIAVYKDMKNDFSKEEIAKLITHPIKAKIIEILSEEENIDQKET